MDGWVHTIVQAIRDANAFLTEPSPLRAMLFGLLLSWCITQPVKFAPSLITLTDREHRFVVRLISFLAAAITVVCLWPGGLALRLLAATICGLCAPVLYKVLIAVLYHFYPWLEPKLSARPSNGS